jgi:ferritin-like metal-binding protein YciE
VEVAIFLYDNCLQIRRKGRERILSSATLAEERKSDETLTKLAQSEVNQRTQAA